MNPTAVNYFVAFTIALVIIFSVLQIRLVRTLWLIVQVTPYEQIGIDNSLKSILVLGDSTGYGTGAKRTVDSVAGQMGADFPEYSIINNSVNGRTIGELLPVAQKVEGEYSLILLQIGGNDILQKRDMSSVQEELEQIIVTLSQHTDKIVMISSGNVGGAPAFSGTKALRYEKLTQDFRTRVLQMSVNEPSFTYVDLFQKPADDPFVQQPKKYVSWDGLHPNSTGYAYWYQALRPVLQDRLR